MILVLLNFVENVFMVNKGILSELKNKGIREYSYSDSLINIEDINQLKKELHECFNPYAENKMIIGKKESLEKIKIETGLMGDILPLDENWNTL